jgi:plasmid stability protein
MATTITVKNIPSGLYSRLRKRADRNRRSINSEILSIFEETLTARPVRPAEVIAAARALRERAHGFTLDQDFLDEAKREGRR